MRRSILMCFACLLLFQTWMVLAQQEIGIPIKKQGGFVLEFKAPYEQLILDLDANNFTNKEATEVALTLRTLFLDKNGKLVDKAMFRPGVRLEFQGERLGGRITATVVRAKISLDDWPVEVKGYFERLENNRAKIDGQTIMLKEGATIRGDKEWQNKTFSSFGEMMLGSYVEVKGTRGKDGVVYATQGTTKPNLLTNTEKRMLTQLRSGLVLPPPNQLAGGQVKIGNASFKLVQDLELQKYVTLVGYKLIPRYAKDVSDDDPAKVTFRFYVIEDNGFNAFALPDGSVFVHTGLLKQLKNEAQLAGVLGHEIAHVTYEHSRRRAENLTPTLVALGSVIAGAATKNNNVALAGMVGAGLLANKFGREEEDEADRVGLFYMADAGYDPREAPKVWRELSKQVKEDAVSNFLYSDHSSAVARLRNLNREIAYNYYETDFSETIAGEDKYKRAVGVYFGWIQPPKPIVIAPADMPRSSKTLVKPVPTKKTTVPRARRKH